MIGFDPEAVRSLFNIPENYVPTMLITIGKADVSKQGLRRYRKFVNEFVEYI